MAYVSRQFEKQVAGMVLPGSGDAMSGGAAQVKVSVLDDILQEFFMARGKSFDGTDIGVTEDEKAILYVREKKSTKVVRKAVISTAKLGCAISGATVGSIVPVAGTALGWVAGAGIGTGVTVLDYGKRG